MALIIATAVLAVMADASPVLDVRDRRDTQITFTELFPRGCCRNAADSEGPSRFAGQQTKQDCEALCAADAGCTGYEWQEFRGDGVTAACRLRRRDDFNHTSGWSRCHCVQKSVIEIPDGVPTPAPSMEPPTPAPVTASPTPGPTVSPTPGPTVSPTPGPTVSPTPPPTVFPTPGPTVSPTPSPIPSPTTASPIPSPDDTGSGSGSGSGDDGDNDITPDPEPFSELPGEPSGFCRDANGLRAGSYKYLTGDDGTVSYEQCVEICLMDSACAGFEYRIADKCEFKLTSQIQTAEADPLGTSRCYIRNP